MHEHAISLNAEKIGYKALTSIRNTRNSVKVHSFFEHALYLQINDNSLITVIKNGDYINPRSILINDSKDLNFKSLGIEDKMNVSFIDEYAVPDKNFLSIRLVEPSTWSPPKTPEKRSVLNVALISLNLRVFRDQIYRCPSREGLVAILEKVELTGPINLFLKPQENSFSEKARPYIERLMWGLHWGDSNMVLSNASSMLGLGPGLTPSCDDFLAGLMTSLTLGGKTLIKERKHDHNFFKKLFGEICKSAKRKTTIYSNHLLAQARRGEGNKAVIELIHSLLTGDLNQVATRSRTLVNMGETSGADIAIGIYYGIRFLISKLELSELEEAGDI
ncbi:MAG: DUF2877 domain-containing protein [Deltaproteobacteria bacterium]|nr:DUF2877 domain-containing protein [Deltaproteobacteria bacterium]